MQQEIVAALDDADVSNVTRLSQVKVLFSLIKSPTCFAST